MQKTLSIYAAAFIITLIGAGATMLIVDTAYSTADAMEFTLPNAADYVH